MSSATPPPGRGRLRLLLVLVVLPLFPVSVIANGVALDWEYRWSEQEQWRRTSEPSNPPGRSGSSLLWLRSRLPEEPVADPTLFVFSIDTAAIFYLDGEEIYSFPEHTPGEAVAFAGWPWHMVRFPEGSAGSELTVRVYSDYRDIGLWGNVIYGNRGDLTVYLFGRDLPRFLSATVLLAVGVMSLIAFASGPGRWNYLLLFSIVSVMTVWTVTSSFSKQFIGGSIWWWDLADASLLMVIFALFSRLLMRYLAGPYKRVFALFFWAYTVFGILTFLLPVTGAVPLHAVYAPQDLLYLVFWLATFVASLRTARSGDPEGTILTVTSVLAGLSGAYSVLVAHSVVAWTDNFHHFTLLILAVGLSILVGRRFSKVYSDLRVRTSDLESLNENLESIVEQRTRELQKEKEKLQELSSIDFLTGLYNRRQFTELLEKAMSNARRRGGRLLFMIFDVDRFKELNDTHGHLVGDVVLRNVAAVISTHLRLGDVAGRFGGDEFVALLTDVDPETLGATVERVRDSVRQHDWFEETYQVTVSSGAALYDAERHGENVDLLIGEADHALYEAKRGGRDQSRIAIAPGPL